MPRLRERCSGYKKMGPLARTHQHEKQDGKLVYKQVTTIFIVVQSQRTVGHNL
jgi:hypothetical protein